MIIPIQLNLSVDCLFDNIERRVIRKESETKVYLETFYQARVDKGRKCPRLDFNVLITSFRSSGELVLLPTIEGACVRMNFKEFDSR